MKQTTKQQPITSQLPNWHLANKRVLVRIDGDVPLKNGAIQNDTRLIDSLPTLNLIKQNKGKIILAMHIGRPTEFDPSLSTNMLIPWFNEHGFSVTLAPDLRSAEKLSHAAPTDIVLLENLRFYPEEQIKKAEMLIRFDKLRVSGYNAFAEQLASCADFYVNEAFGTSHRADASLTLVPQQFAPDHRTIGLRCQQELNALAKLTNNPERPLVIILGGGKVQDKLPYLEQLLYVADYILVCPAVAFTFMKAQGQEVGLSLVADKALPSARRILALPEAKTKLIFPVDYQVAQDTIDGTLSTIDANAFTPTMVGIAIGPKTITQFTEILERARTVFLNGPMGFEQRPETMHATCALLTAIAHSPAYSVLGGGDTIDAACRCKVSDEIDQLSTGGGAALAYVSGVSLPGLALFT